MSWFVDVTFHLYWHQKSYQERFEISFHIQIMPWVPRNRFLIVRPSAAHLTSFNILQRNQLQEKNTCLSKYKQLKQISEWFDFTRVLQKKYLSSKMYNFYIFLDKTKGLCSKMSENLISSNNSKVNHQQLSNPT